MTGGPAVHLGEGCARRLGELLAAGEVRSLFLVTGSRSYAGSGAADLLEPFLRTVQVERFAGVRPNPELGQVEAAVDQLRRRPGDAVLGVGGGSVLDVAKLAAVLAGQPHPPAEYVVGGRALDVPRTCRLLLAPTTAGSGSEATRFATVFAGGRKHSLDHPALHADAVFVDPALSRSQPPDVAAAAGLDALCQAVESFWSTRSTGGSRRLAAEALDLLLDRPGALPAGSAASALAALRAGQAIDITRTTAAHAFAYPLTARFGVAHGHACALNLAWLLPFCWGVGEADAADPRGAAFVRARLGEVAGKLGAADGDEAGRMVLARVAAAGLAPTLGRLGVGARDLDRIVRDGLASERAANNPRRLTPAAAHDGLRSLL